MACHRTLSPANFSVAPFIHRVCSFFLQEISSEYIGDALPAVVVCD